VTRWLRSVLLFAVSCAIAYGATAGVPPVFVAGTFDPPRLAPEFELSGSNGKAVTLSQYRGRVVVLAFGFTSCTDVCPVTLATLTLARKKLGPQGAHMQVIYVTVDPQRDDAGRMRDYLAGFDPSFIGGTGTTEQLAAVREEYGILAQRKAAANGYGVTHSSFAYLIDRAGKLRALMPYGQSADDYAHDLRILLAN
jgi:protein SCO1/2